MDELNNYYLAYGANTNFSDMSRRCPGAQYLGQVSVADHELVFCTHADVRYQPGASTICALWRIEPNHLASLDKFEGYPSYYNRKLLPVIHQQHSLNAWIYHMTGSPSLASPTQDYWDICQQGYLDCDLPLNQLILALSHLWDQEHEP